MHPQGSSVLKAINNKEVNVAIRQDIVRIAVAELIKVQGNYPPNEAKVSLAKSLVTEFPILKNEMSPLGFVNIRIIL